MTPDRAGSPLTVLPRAQRAMGLTLAPARNLRQLLDQDLAVFGDQGTAMHAWHESARRFPNLTRRMRRVLLLRQARHQSPPTWAPLIVESLRVALRAVLIRSRPTWPTAATSRPGPSGPTPPVCELLAGTLQAAPCAPPNTHTSSACAA